MLFYAILGLIFVSASLLMLFILSLINKRSNPISQRLKFLQNSTDAFNLREELLRGKGLREKKIDPKIEKAISVLTQFSKKDEQDDSKLKKSLMQAGFYHENATRFFSSLRIFGAIIIFFTYAIMGYWAGMAMKSIILIGGMMALMGYLLPNLYLASKIRQRQDEMASGLPDALDFLVICVEAGLGLNSALIRVGQELRLRCKSLAEELLLVNQEMRTGLSREQALRNLSERNKQIKDLKVLAAAIILSDRLGTNIADTLRAQSDSLRTKVRQRAEERAAKAGIKMLFPLVFFILPALFIVILGPGIIMVIKTLLPITK